MIGLFVGAILSLHTDSMEVRMYKTSFSYETPAVSSEYYLPTATYVLQDKIYYGPVPLETKEVLSEAPRREEHESEMAAGKADKQAEIETRPVPVAPVDKEAGTQPRSVAVYFAFDSSALTAEETKKLKELNTKEITIIKGSSSPEGASDYNMKLSKRRAEAVKQSLEDDGVKVNKTEWKGDEECSLPKSMWQECRKVEVRY